MMDICMQARVSLVSNHMVAYADDMTERLQGMVTDLTQRIKPSLSIVCDVSISPYLIFAPIGGFRLKGLGYFKVLKKKE